MWASPSSFSSATSAYCKRRHPCLFFTLLVPFASSYRSYYCRILPTFSNTATSNILPASSTTAVILRGRRLLYGWRNEENEGSIKEVIMSGDGGREKNTTTAGRTPAWTVCLKCNGEGKLKLPPSRKARIRYKRAREEEMGDNNKDGSSSLSPPPARIEVCKQCQGAGIVVVGEALEELTPNNSTCTNSFPRICIIGGGLAGLALATACSHRGIPHDVYERDSHFSQRAQGYGLTMQQASKALKSFSITVVADGLTSTKHVVHKTDGTIVGQWGNRVWGRSDAKEPPRRQNVHLPRQSLRYQLLQSAGGSSAPTIKWNHRLLSYRETEDDIVLSFQVGDSDQVVESRADLLVGADGIRGKVREQLIGNEQTPLRYLGCIVILGICPLLPSMKYDLLDGETVFQTADGTTRIYMMPYSTTEYMWQLSFPQSEEEASALSSKGPEALKKESIRRCQSWHNPIPEILKATPEKLVSGYPVYDRALLTLDDLSTSSKVTLIGDAAHPMSPFKGQGANQALLDALSLSRAIYSTTTKNGSDSLAQALLDFEKEMLERSARKVKASAQAAQFLHTDTAIQEGDITRAAAANKLGATEQQEELK